MILLPNFHVCCQEVVKFPRLLDNTRENSERWYIKKSIPLYRKFRYFRYDTIYRYRYIDIESIFWYIEASLTQTRRVLVSLIATVRRWQLYSRSSLLSVCLSVTRCLFHNTVLLLRFFCIVADLLTGRVGCRPSPQKIQMSVVGQLQQENIQATGAYIIALMPSEQ